MAQALGERGVQLRADAQAQPLLPGSFPIHDLPDVHVELTDAPPGDYATVAGLVLVALGRIPHTPGDRVDLADWTIEVSAVERNTITEVRLVRRAASGAA